MLKGHKRAARLHKESEDTMKLILKQKAQTYYMYTPNGQLIASVFMGQDGQYIQDIQCLNVIAKALEKRWNIAK